MERLLKMLDASSEKCYCQEQAITSLAMVADASETTFEKYYVSIMPLLLSVLQNAHGTDHLKLRVKAMECAGLIGMFESSLGRTSTFSQDNSDRGTPRHIPSRCTAPYRCFNPYPKYVPATLYTPTNLEHTRQTLPLTLQTRCSQRT